MKKPTIGVVTITLRDLEGVLATGESIKNQSVKPDWYVIDGDSGSAVVSVLATLDGLTEWCSEPDLGIYDAMAKGFNRAGNDYVIFLNSGDILANDRVIEDILQVINDHRGPDVIYANARYNYGLNKKPTIRHARNPSWAIYHSVPSNQQATIYRSAAIRAIVNRPEFRNFSICGDYYLASSLHINSGVREYVSDLTVCDFALGGRSTFETRLLAREADSIQRDVLKMGYISRSISRVLRSLSMARALRRHRAASSRAGIRGKIAQASRENRDGAR